MLTISNAATHAPIARTDLTRLGIRLPLPKPLAMLIIDLFDLLPESEAKALPAAIVLATPNDADLRHCAAQLLIWLLGDAEHGLVTLTENADITLSIKLVINDLLTPPTRNAKVSPFNSKGTTWNAELVQQHAWHAYMDQRTEQSTAARQQLRINWMIAAAATDATRPTLPSSLTSAVHAAAVAWTATATTDSATTNMPVQFYQAVSRQLLFLLAHQPVGIRHRDRVSFQDADKGHQTGTVIGLMPNRTAPTAAVVELDHATEGMTQQVDIDQLSKLEASAA